MRALRYYAVDADFFLQMRVFGLWWTISRVNKYQAGTAGGIFPAFMADIYMRTR